MSHGTELRGRRNISIVIGCHGQDGYYLCETLKKDNLVIQVTSSSRAASLNSQALSSLNLDRYALARDLNSPFSCDLTDQFFVSNLIRMIQPDGIFYLAAAHTSSEIGLSKPISSKAAYEVNVRAPGVLIQSLGEFCPRGHFIYAASSRMYSAKGYDHDEEINEQTPLNPSDVYGETKAKGHELVRSARSEMNLIASSLILFNHESPRRGPSFMSQVLAEQLAGVLKKETDTISVRDSSSRVDWSDARDIVDAVVTVYRDSYNGDVVLASGRCRSVEELVQEVCPRLGINQPISVQSISQKSRSVGLYGDWSRARDELRWGGSRPITNTLCEMTLNHLRHS